MQFALWTGQKLQPGVPLYNMVHTFRIQGEMDPDTFASAFKKLVAGTDVLRAVVDETSDKVPLFDIRQVLAPSHQFTDVQGNVDPEAKLGAIRSAQAGMSFPLGDCLYDSHLVRIGPAEFVWCFTLHHLIVDFLSVTLLYERMASLVADEKVIANWPTFQSYAEWSTVQQDSPRAKRAQAYWERNIRSDDGTRLAVFGNALTKSNPRAARIELKLGQARSQRIDAMAAEPPFRLLSRDLALLNMFATLLWAWFYRVSNRDQLTVGMPMHNRSSAALRDTVGLLINILPVSELIDSDDTFSSLARRIGLSTLDATKYANFTTAQTDMHRGFDVILNFLNGQVGDFAGLPCDFEWHHSGYADPHHALRLQVQDFSASGEFTLFFDINEDLLSGQERHRITQGFISLVDACLASVDTRIAGVDLMPKVDRERQLVWLNATQRPITTSTSLNDLLRHVWTESADEVALVYRGDSITYGDLDEKVSNVAAELRHKGIGQGGIVAIWMDRSPDLVASILATLRLGAAYVPIDPAQPLRRVERILADAAPALILTDAARQSSSDAETIQISQVAAAQDSHEGYVSVAERDAAYVVYTSGSTGDPKGVVVEHRGIVNYIAWAAEQYVEGQGIQQPAMPFYSSVAVDLTLTSILLPLATGGKIIIYEAEDLRNDLSIVDVFEKDEVDILKLTPAHLSLLQRLGKTANNIKSLIVGGENLTVATASASLSMFPAGVAIYNEYGPTETVVGCMIHRYDPASDAGDSVPIGKPIANMRVYALDRHRMPVPPGVTGELFVAGTAVAREYLNRPDLTADAFVALPSVNEERAYRTGDLVRFSVDGLLTYLGRRDDQIKIRGNRVELGEIEAALQRHPEVISVGIAVEERSGTRANAAGESSTVNLCSRCGLPDNYPQAQIDAETRICELCRQYDANKTRIDGYFREREELRQIVADIAEPNVGEPNAIALTSGGKDSTYALHQLVRMGLKPLVFTLDNGFISEQALTNVRRVVDDLGLELVVGRTPHMNAIFADSLQRHCNVCNGCFKTIYTLSINLAIERGIDYIFTGLSRGQLFETRLAPEMFAGKHYSVATIEQNVTAARVAYHRRHDAVNERLDVSAFSNDELFEKIKIIDFYRYWDVDLEELYNFLESEAAWSRPADTGRSTNCLINEAGISVHKARRGYHNYALPYSWDVRLGHKTRAEALHELNDEIDFGKVREMLSEVGYDEDNSDSELHLIGAYTARTPLDVAEVRNFLGKQLPGYMIPQQLIQVDELALNTSGKLDRQRLKSLAVPSASRTDDTKARNDLEHAVFSIWTDVLGLEQLGIYENFFDIGGTSLPALQIVARCEHAFDIELPLVRFFASPSVAGLAETIEDILVQQLEVLSNEEAERALEALEIEE